MSSCCHTGGGIRQWRCLIYQLPSLSVRTPAVMRLSRYSAKRALTRCLLPARMGERSHVQLLNVVSLSDILGMVTMSNMTSRMLTGSAKGPPVLRTDPVTKVLYKQFEMVGQLRALYLT